MRGIVRKKSRGKKAFPRLSSKEKRENPASNDPCFEKNMIKKRKSKKGGEEGGKTQQKGVLSQKALRRGIFLRGRKGESARRRL